MIAMMLMVILMMIDSGDRGDYELAILIFSAHLVLSEG